MKNKVNCEYWKDSDINSDVENSLLWIQYNQNTLTSQMVTSITVATVNQNVTSFTRRIITLKWSSFGESNKRSLCLLLCDESSGERCNEVSLWFSCDRYLETIVKSSWALHCTESSNNARMNLYGDSTFKVTIYAPLWQVTMWPFCCHLEACQKTTDFRTESSKDSHVSHKVISYLVTGPKTEITVTSQWSYQITVTCQ